jgi:hypothetical protein
MPAQDTVVMEGVRLIFRNFEGREGQYNQEGAQLRGHPARGRRRGHAGRRLERQVPQAFGGGRGRIEEGPPWLPVKIGYGKGSPPKITMVTDRGKTQLARRRSTDLDWAEITNVDLIVRPYHYDVRGSQGISAYLKTMYVTIEEDELERKYAEMDSQ